jgi:hypothetical protein
MHPLATIRTAASAVDLVIAGSSHDFQWLGEAQQRREQASR